MQCRLMQNIYDNSSIKICLRIIIINKSIGNVFFSLLSVNFSQKLFHYIRLMKCDVHIFLGVQIVGEAACKNILLLLLHKCKHSFSFLTGLNTLSFSKLKGEFLHFYIVSKICLLILSQMIKMRHTKKMILIKMIKNLMKSSY